MTFAEKSARLAKMRAEGKAGLSYEILIDEAQRLALLALIEKHVPQGNEGPLDYWVSMLESLPDDEAETPGTLHGFCI